jgi:diguanylate cyclase (GGDEF)-like protein
VVFRSHEQHVYDDIRIRHDGDGTCVLLPILFSESYFHVRMDDHPLYSEVRRLSGWVSSWTGAGSALTVTLLIILVTRNYRRVIRRISTSEKRYKETRLPGSADRAYTRHYLNVWRSGLPRRFDAPWSLVIIDADDFKMINDRYDHSTGDRVLAAIARMVQRSIREEDLLIRFGGDEFLVCMRSCTRERAEAAMRRISADIAGDRSFPFRISVSFGVAEIRTPDEYATGISEADKRMYEMKNARKGTAGTP